MALRRRQRRNAFVRSLPMALRARVAGDALRGRRFALTKLTVAGDPTLTGRRHARRRLDVSAVVSYPGANVSSGVQRPPESDTVVPPASETRSVTAAKSQVLAGPSRAY